MGRYTYPCPQCGQTQTRKTGIETSEAITHALCASCAEAKNGEPQAEPARQERPPRPRA